MRRRCRQALFPLLLAAFALVCAGRGHASLAAYDAAVAADATAGLAPLARLTNQVTLTGANRAAFDFGASSGNVTIEFILEGNPNAGSGSAYLAVGANTSSNLRYEQFNNTGQLGFTQLGVLDYLFSPAVPSPVSPTHIAYVWNAAARTMTLYLNGSLAGSVSGVSANFAMPAGAGWLGANPNSTEAMTGVIYRVTVYDEVISTDAVRRHADAFNDVVPNIVSFTANPTAYLAPGSSTLSWRVENAAAVFLDGANVTGTSNTVVSPNVTTAYTLTATNGAGSATRSVTVTVNPPPTINTFTADRRYVGAGRDVALNWNVRFGQRFFISPAPGDVTAQTSSNGVGSVTVQPGGSTTYVLTASNAFGVSTAGVAIHIVQPANHPVISEFMAENESTLADEDGDFPDWIEIHNPATAPVNLAGYFLTDNDAEPQKWAFPQIVLPADGYLIVFASGKNRTNAAAPLHANFSLNNGGEYLALVGPGPQLVHGFAPMFPPQRADISFGLLGGDTSTARLMGAPTPGAMNSDAPAPPARVQFSRISGLFANAFALSLIAPDSNAVIRYTLNGSTPSATNGSDYAGPLTITNTTRLRAVALVSNLASRVSSAQFIRLANDLVGYTSSLPMMVIENFGAGTIPQKGWSGTGAGIKQVPRQSAVWATFEREGGASALTNPPGMFSEIAIRGRGAFSSTWRQKPYSVEAVNADGDERAVSPLGMPEHADWVLYFPDPDNNKDPALLFNTFAYELSRQLGRQAVRFRWVEAFINEDGGDLRLADRRGVYAIVEKVSRGKDRLDFTRLSTSGTNGSWLLNINRMDPEPETGWPAENGATQPWFFHTAGQNRIQETPPNAAGVGDDEPIQSNGFLNFDNPSGYTINTSQRAAVENWFKQFEDVLWNNALWRHPENGYRKYLDPVDFADYFVLNTLTRNGDGLLISMFPWKGDDGKLRMGPAWDYNWNAYYVSGAATGTLLHRPDRLWYKRLFTDPDFYQLYIDRWWDMRRGAMSNAGMDAIIDAQMNDITPAKALLNGIATTNDWVSRLTQFRTWLKDRANWIDSNYLRPPVFNTNGGAVTEGFQITISGTNGTIHFTTDGADPRAPGGAVAASAQTYQAPFAIYAQTLVQARIKNGTNWSGLTKALFVTPQDLSKLAITEIMYNPPASGGFSSDDVEFLELKNTGTNALDLGALSFTAGITFTFTNGTLLAPGGFFVLARNAAAFGSKYPGVAVNGVYSGRLDNGGETLRLATALGNTVLTVDYNDRAPWPLAADGWGFSIVPRNSIAPGNSDNGANWRASLAHGGSPGADDPEPNITRVLINEILSHTDPPEIDTIELFNPSAQAVDISGWFLSDDGAVPKKFRIPDGTTISPGGYVVFTENDFNPTPGTLLNFSVDSAGDALYLVSANASGQFTGHSHGVSFGAAANGVSFGHHVNSVGEEQFPAQFANTLGAPNAGPRVGPVVITEIMYHPDANGDEFIELRNLTAADLPLFEATNTWRVNGLGFSFPANTVLPSNGLALIVATNPAAFRAKYAVPGEVPIFGPFTGTLQDSGERLELQRPEPEDASGATFITVDAVRYNDKVPWPSAADGGGPSLQRRVLTAHGDDPTNWFAALPSPGSISIANDPPVITQQPLGFRVPQGAATNLAVAAAGAAPLAFQWYRDGEALPGATNATLVFAAIQPAEAGTYFAIVFNGAGTAFSSNALVDVIPPVRFTIQPASQNVLPGTNVTLSAEAVGAGTVRYRWHLDNEPIAGATNASYSFAGAWYEHHGSYHVTVADDLSAARSSNAFIYVLIPPGFAEQPKPATVLQGQTAVFSVVATGAPPLFFRWTRNGLAYPSDGTGTLVVTNALVAGSFRCLVANQARTNVGSSAAQLVVLADHDRDGMWDNWEREHGFNTNNVSDALGDADGDGMINRDEYVAGTNPTNALSLLKIVVSATNAHVLTFVAQTNLSYTVEWRGGLASGAWSPFTSIAPQSLVRTVQVHAVESAEGGESYFRVVTPERR